MSGNCWRARSSFFAAMPVLSPGRKWLVMPEDKQVRIYDALTGALTSTIPTGEHASGVSVSEDGLKLAVLQTNSLAVWSLTSYALRPQNWTSADAAGLPILPGLLRYDEVAARNIDHAIRFTTNVTDKSYVWPARHQAGSVSDPAYPPMGARFRLKASYVIATTLRADTKAVLRAMKRYGLVLADNGSPWYFQGTSDTRWPEALLDQLKQVPALAFEAVDTSSLMISPDSMQIKTAP